ncbi:MAG: hypothetical protein ACK4ZJ_19000, partial [Allorhizobium sp.]
MHCDKPRDFLGLTANGGYAEYMVAGASAFCRVPQGWSAVEAAPVVCTFGTVWRGGVVRGRARAGETVLVTGATGGSFTLGLAGARTAPLSHNVTAAEV